MERNNVSIHSKFNPLFNSNTRYNIITGGRGSSKSYSVSLFLCMLTFEPNQKILFTRYTLTSAKVSIIPEFLEKIDILNVSDHFVFTQDSIVNTQTGSSIIFKGIQTSSGNQTAALKSIHGITTWILDEAEELPDESIFDKIDLSIRTKGVDNKVILILNPTTKESWIYERFFLSRSVVGGSNTVKDDVTYIHTTYLDNIKNLDQSFLNNVEYIKKNKPSKYDHEILGGWIDRAEGAIYEDWIEGEFPENYTTIYGMDFGFNDKDALTKIAVDAKNMKIYVKEELFQNSLGSADLAEIMLGICGTSALIIADAAQKRLINDLFYAGLNIKRCKKGQHSVIRGIKTIQSYTLVVDPSSKNLKKSLSLYSWHDKRANVPNHDYSDLMDSMRYGAMELIYL